MFGLGYPELALFLLVVAALVIGGRYLGRHQVVEADERHELAVRPEQVELPLTRLLSALPGARLAMGPACTWRVSVRRTPAWALILGAFLVLFGPTAAAAGLVIAVLAREDVDLHVLVRHAGDGSTLVLIGRTRHALARTLREAAAGLTS